MKKFFTTLGCGLLLATGLTANAAVGAPTIEPANNSKINEEFPNGGIITLTWSGAEIALTGGTETLSLEMLVDGEPWDPWGEGNITAMAFPGEYETNDFGGYWVAAEESETFIIQPGNPNIYDRNYTVQITLPANSITVGGENYSENLILNYKVIWDPSSDEDDDTNYIVLGEEFTAGPDAQVWVLDNSSYQYGDITEYYFESNKSTNYSSNITFERSTGLVLPLTAIQGSDGNYVYSRPANNGGYQITDDKYTFTFTGNEDVEFTLIQGDYVEYPEFELNVPFNATSSDNTFKMYNAKLNGEYYLATNSSTNLMNPQKISLITSTNTDLFSMYTVTAVKNTTNDYYGYNITLKNVPENTTLTFKYSGTDPVQFTLSEGQYTESGAATYMPKATYSPNSIEQDSTDATIEITWGQPVSFNNIDQQLNVLINGAPTGTILQCQDYLSLKDNAESSNIVVLAMGAAFSNEFEAGTYTFTLPSGLVKNVAGDLNSEQEISVTVMSDATGEINPAYGTTFEPGEDVKFTITYKSAPKVNASAQQAPVFVETTDGKWYENYEWKENQVYIEDNSVIINLGTTLAAGTYQLTFQAGAVTIDDVENDAMSNVQFTVEAPPTVDYTSVDPENGALVDEWPTINILWEDYDVTLANQNAEITVTLDGEAVNADAFSWNLIDEDGQYVEEGAGAGIAISINNTWPQNETWVYGVNVPEGMFNVVSDDVTGVNAAVKLQYTGVLVNEDNFLDNAVPARGATMKSLQSFNISWSEGYTAELNSSLANQITVGEMFNPTSGGTATIAANADGTYTVTLAQEYTTNGYVYITFPEGLFNLTVGGMKVASPEMQLSYQISLYTLVPGAYSYVYEPLEYFTIYADNIQLVGDVKDIKVFDSMEFGDDGNMLLLTEGASYKSVTDETYGSGIQVNLGVVAETNVQIVIPANTFSFDGENYGSQITFDVYVTMPVELPEPTVTPADGAKLLALQTVEISWNDSPLYLTWYWAEDGEPFTLTITPADAEVANEPININECVSVVGETNEFTGMDVAKSLLIEFDTPYTAEGKYVISVPADYVELEDYEYATNTPFVLTYYVGDSSSIGNLVDAVDGVWVVYNLNGVKVLETSNQSDLSKLAKGMYVINGKKCIVR